jgi:hypothetical protein
LDAFDLHHATVERFRARGYEVITNADRWTDLDLERDLPAALYERAVAAHRGPRA